MKKAIVWIVVGASFLGLAQVQTPSFDLKVSGEKTWTLRLGLGSSELLSPEKLPAGQPVLTQTLRADIEGKALGFLTLKASFNDQLGPGFQDFLVTIERAPWKGELGRFVVGAEGDALGVYNKRVLGVRGELSEQAFSVRALLARLEGISESRLFRGERGRAETLFSLEDPREPWRPAPYLSSVEGLAFWPLRISFVEGLSQVKLALAVNAEFGRFLGDWGLDYLQARLAEKPDTVLLEGQYLVLRDEGDVLALRVAPEDLLRRRIQEAIEDHNTQAGLTGKDRKGYPFVEGSELEAHFLREFASFGSLSVDGELYPIREPSRRRYLLLGERDVLEGTVEVWIKLPGEAEFRPSTDPALTQFQWRLYPEPGVLGISFPQEFFRAGGALRVGFAYKREGASFMLGLSVVPGSERVYLSGKLLTRGADYTIDYEVGMLLVFPTLGPEDELKVDFERQRGALGVFTEYERYFLGVELSAPGWDGLRLSFYRAADFGEPKPTTRTMPNAHSVVSLSLTGKALGWAYRLDFGGSENLFPSDDNERLPFPNRINAVTSAGALDGEYVIFAHQNGLTVYKDGGFAGYGAASGLSGRAAHALLPVPGQLLVGTDAGLTVVRLGEASPLDRVRSWVRLYREDWNKERPSEDRFVGKEVLALAQGGGRVYLATERELAALAPADLENPKRWERIPLPEGSPRSTALLAVGNLLYLGTENGLFLREGTGWSPVEDLQEHVYALLTRGEDIYVATREGIRIVRGGSGAGWLIYGKQVYGMALHGETLWYAAEDGLWKERELTPEVSGRMTAVGSGAGAVWAGGEADEDFQLELWRVADRPELFLPRQTRIDGRDTGRFRDIPASEHTRIGFTGSLTLSQTFGDWQWEVRASSRLPGYEEIGRAGRSDGHGLGLAGRYAAGPTSLDLRLRWDVRDLTTRPSGRVSGGVDWRWTGGPTAYISLTPTLAGAGLLGIGKTELGWRAGLSGSTPALSWGLTTSGNFTYPALYAAGDLKTTITFRPTASWTVEGSWTRPFRTRGALGDESFLFTARWASGTPLFSWTASWQEAFRHSLTTGTWRGERTVQADVRGSPWRTKAGEITPRLSATWRLTPTEARWEARLTANLVQAPVSLLAGATLAQGYRPATGRSERSLGLSLSVEHSGWDGIRPSLRWDRSWTVLSHPRYPEQVTEKEEAVLRVSVEPKGARWRDLLTLTWKPREGTLSLTNRLTWPLESGSLVGEATATLKKGALEAKASAQLGVPLDAILKALGAKPIGDAWGLNAEAGYLFSLKPGTAARQAFTLGATLIARF